MLDHLRLERLTQPDALLRKGAGGGIDDANFNACVMQAVDYVSGGTGLSDIPECASHAITSYCISLNDADVFAEYRQELMALVPEIVGTARGLDTEVRIAEYAAVYAAKSAEYAAECAADSAEYAADKRAIWNQAVTTLRGMIAIAKEVVI